MACQPRTFASFLMGDSTVAPRNTHVGPKGSAFFDKMAWEELIGAVPVLKSARKSLDNLNLASKLP
jgi:hypothetical protein